MSESRLSKQYDRLRSCVITQCGFGMDGCKLCGVRWMRGMTGREATIHTDCIAMPKQASERRGPRTKD